MNVPQAIIELVERFQENLAVYTSGTYNETQLRREFIDPFFKVLGWDIDNTAGHAEAYKDVIHEDAIRIGGAVKAPDYCFRIGGTRKFFVEAKKPSVDIAQDAAPAYQLRRYAWSAGLPLSILTDFEEFAVYDCRIKPDHADRASAARVMYFTFRDYAARWEEIAAVFAKGAVLKGSFDRYAESGRLKKGTAGVDEAFLREIETWRDLLARNIALRNPDLSQRELNTAVTLTINRIIFLRICEDRGIEPYGQLQTLLNGGGVYARLVEIFYRADDRYNSGLFHFRQEKDRTTPPDNLTLELAIDDKALKEIFHGLYYPESPYEFSVLPADILGRVYEQFLGKIIRLTAGHQAKVEDKPEVKKAGGVFYTPKYIVDYIVDRTVGKLMEGRTIAQADRVRILDPACGSGSFLIQAYQYLLDWHRDRYVEGGPEKRTKGKRPVLYQAIGGDWRLTTAERKRILLNNIYGVDIDPQAVEVTKLSLLLKVLEGESGETLMSQIKLFHERALPDLSGNIRCGNSLVGPDFYDGELPGLLNEEERYRINVFDWKAEFPEVFASGGFDVVLGNPPYVRQELLGEIKEYLKGHYASFDGVADLFVYFMEKGIQLLKPGGLFGIIVSSSFLRTSFAAPLRTFLKQAAAVERIIDFGGLPVFANAKDTYVCIPILRKGKSTATVTICQVPSTDLPDLDVYVAANSFSIPLAQFTAEVWSLKNQAESALFAKISTAGVPLGEYVDKKIFYGIKTGLNEAFIISSAARAALIAADARSAELIKPLLGGEDIRRYVLRPKDQWIIFTRRGVAIEQYPAIKRHLGQWQADLTPKKNREDKRGRKPGRYEWYEIQDDVAYFAHFEQPKIIFPDITKEPRFYLDPDGNYLANTAYCLGTDDRYLLGILNSRLFWFAIGNISIPFGVRAGKYRYRLIYQYMEKVPIRRIDFSDPADRERHDRMVALVEEMLALHRRLAAARTDHERTNLKRQIEAADRRIDRLVYDLYDLTEEEIRIVEKD